MYSYIKSYKKKYILISSHKIIVLSKDICLNSPLIQFKDKVFVLKNTLSPEVENSLLSINYKNLDDTYRTRFFFIQIYYFQRE